MSYEYQNPNPYIQPGFFPQQHFQQPQQQPFQPQPQQYGPGPMPMSFPPGMIPQGLPQQPPPQAPFTGYPQPQYSASPYPQNISSTNTPSRGPFTQPPPPPPGSSVSPTPQVGSPTPSQPAPRPSQNSMSAPAPPVAQPDPSPAQQPQLPSQPSQTPRGKATTAQQPGAQPPALSPAMVAREKERVTLLLEINGELLQGVVQLQAEGKTGGGGQQNPAGKEGEQKRVPPSKEYVECMRCLQANLAYLAATADRAHKPAASIPPSPAIMDAPAHMTDLVDRYAKLKELFPDAKAVAPPAGGSRPKPGVNGAIAGVNLTVGGDGSPTT